MARRQSPGIKSRRRAARAARDRESGFHDESAKKDRRDMSGKETQGGDTFVCGRCKKANPRLAEAPFPNDLGRKIHETICKECWREWFAMSVKVVNEYRLNLMAPDASKVYDEVMCEFLGIER
jgi:Fe-S cluster biosynthesis and repair protein YggX